MRMTINKLHPDDCDCPYHEGFADGAAAREAELIRFLESEGMLTAAVAIEHRTARSTGEGSD